MINFEEELKKFHPSLEVEGTEKAIKEHDFSDMTDVMLEVFKQNAAVMQPMMPGEDQDY